MKQRQDKVVSMLFQCCFNVGHRRCINVVPHWKSDVGFCFIFNGMRLNSSLKVTLYLQAVARRCTIKKGVLRNTCAGVSFWIKLWRLATLLKKTLRHNCFLVNFVNFLRALFYWKLTDDCFCILSISLHRLILIKLANFFMLWQRTNS